MIRLEFSPAAIEKLENIASYIATELDNPIAARRTINNPLNDLERLTRFPESGPKLASFFSDIPEAFRDIRYLVCGNYIAMYAFDDPTVRILQLYHGTEDYIRHLLH